MIRPFSLRSPLAGLLAFIALVTLALLLPLGNQRPGRESLPTADSLSQAPTASQPDPESETLSVRPLGIEPDEVRAEVEWLHHEQWIHPRHEFIRFYRRLQHSSPSVQLALVDTLQSSDHSDARLLSLRLAGMLGIPIARPNSETPWQEWAEFAGIFFWNADFPAFQSVVAEYVQAGGTIDTTMVPTLLRATASENGLPAARYFRIGLWSDYFVSAALLNAYADSSASILARLANDLRPEERILIADKIAKVPTPEARDLARALAGTGYSLPDFPHRPGRSAELEPEPTATAADLIRSFQRQAQPPAIPRSTVMEKQRDVLSTGTTAALQEGYFLWIIAKQST